MFLGRSKEFKGLLQDADVTANGCFMGTDLAAEEGIKGYDRALAVELQLRQGLTPQLEELAEIQQAQSGTWRVPLMDKQTNAEAIEPKVYAGSTPWLQKRFAENPNLGNPDRSSLRDRTIYTEYPNITKMYLDGRGYNGVQALQEVIP